MSRLAPLGAVVGALTAVVAAGCSSAARPATDPSTQARLRYDLRTVVDAASRHDLSGARAALGKLTAAADAAHQAGRLDDSRFAAISSAAASVRADLVTLTPVPTRTVTVRPTPAPPKPGPGGKGKDGPGHKKNDSGEGD